MVTETGLEDARRRTQRLVFRCLSEFLLDESRALIAAHDRDFVCATIFLAVAQASRGGGDETRRSVSVRAVAQSLGLPYETTRRKVLELEERGFCRRVSAQRVAATQEAMEGPEARAAALRTLADVETVISDLKSLGYDLGQLDAGGPVGAAPDREALAADAARLAQDFLLRVLEAGVIPHGSMLDALVYTALITANADQITRDPAMAWKYSGSDTPPPDDLRRPATIAELAQRLAIPRETMRRRVTRMLELGRCEAVKGGYMSSMDYMQSQPVDESGAMIVQRFAQLVQGLRQVGFDVEVIAAQPRAAARAS